MSNVMQTADAIDKRFVIEALKLLQEYETARGRDGSARMITGRRIAELLSKEADLDTYQRVLGVHLTALRIISATLGWPFKGDTSKSCIDLAELAAKKLREMSEDRLTEMGFAYERATDVIASSCVVESFGGGEIEESWFDLDSSPMDLSDEVKYLDSRRLLQRHPQNPDWVMILDEGEPLEATHG